ncbi:MAG: 4-hydroxy-2-oxoheptanedioate aldolase [Chloroflexi bacterium]|jgi:2-keto-3-deoxy-L-rhamnonate aldolase RhmA|nr:MAG: 4-hydroxy-2-oxoheptanedioate aldolase [Chloroflexota bacterium]
MNTVKDLLQSGKTAIGASASVGTDVGFLADSGYDFLLFDTQHSPVEIKELRPQLQAMRGKNAIPIVRVGENRADQICYALDIGAKGIIVPMVNTKAEAADMVQWCKYPFAGVRSSAGMRGEWGKFENYREYMDAVNEQLLVIPMIETVEALDNLDEILSVPGIDILLIGPSDLSINLDVTLDYPNPKYQAALDKIAAACANAGVVPGMYFIPPDMEPSHFMAKGFRFFTLPWNGWATEGVQNGLAGVRG